MAIVVNKADPNHYTDKSLSAGQFQITPSDTVNLPAPIDAIYVGGAGDISYLASDGNTVLLKTVPVGATKKLNAIRINSTNTTATLLVGYALQSEK